MNVGVYVSWEDLKIFLEIKDVLDDSLLKQFSVGASRLFDTLTHRRFYPSKETRYFDDPETPPVWPGYWSPLARFSPRRRYRLTYACDSLALDEDLLEVLSLTTNNGSTTIASTDYFLLSAENNNRPPYNTINLEQGTGAAFVYSSTPQRANAVSGIWGYHQEWAGAWNLTTATVSDNPLSSSATSATVSNIAAADIYGIGKQFKRQQLIRFGAVNTGEYAFITDISSTALTLVRGVNGTTAASQASGTVIYTFQPWEAVAEVVRVWGSYLFLLRKSPHGLGGSDTLGQREIASLLGADLTRLALAYERR